MPAILLGGEKGGTGKSTTAVNLAIMAAIMGHDVILVDATLKQASSANFITRRNELSLKPTPSCVKILGRYLHEELRDLSERYEFVIIDAGGYDSVELRSAMAASCVTKMYSPFKPSEFDLETLKAIDDLVYLARSYNQKLECNVLFNQTPTTAGGVEILNDAKKLVESYEYLQVAKTVICNRMSIQHAAANGLSVVEYEEERRQKMPKYRVQDYLFKGSIEFCNLYKEVFEEEFTSPNFVTLDEYRQSNFKEEVPE